MPTKPPILLPEERAVQVGDLLGPEPVLEAANGAVGESQVTQMFAMLTAQLTALSENQAALSRRLDAMTAVPTPTPTPAPDYELQRAATLGQGPLVTAGAVAREQSDLQRYAAAGLIAPPNPSIVPQLSPAQAEALVAFVPKDDPLNPKYVVFNTWINGNKFSSKRGQVMMLPRGHAISLAANGHGYVVDIELMQGLQIPKLPQFARPDSWDGLPLDDQTSVPPQYYHASA